VDTIQRMAKKYVDLDHLQIVVVGDAKEVRTAVDKYGTVLVFDTEGKPVTAKPETPAAATRDCGNLTIKVPCGLQNKETLCITSVSSRFLLSLLWVRQPCTASA